MRARSTWDRQIVPREQYESYCASKVLCFAHLRIVYVVASVFRTPSSTSLSPLYRVVYALQLHYVKEIILSIENIWKIPSSYYRSGVVQGGASNSVTMVTKKEGKIKEKSPERQPPHKNRTRIYKKFKARHLGKEGSVHKYQDIASTIYPVSHLPSKKANY